MSLKFGIARDIRYARPYKIYNTPFACANNTYTRRINVLSIYYNISHESFVAFARARVTFTSANACRVREIRQNVPPLVKTQSECTHAHSIDT